MKNTEIVDLVVQCMKAWPAQFQFLQRNPKAIVISGESSDTIDAVVAKCKWIIDEIADPSYDPIDEKRTIDLLYSLVETFSDDKTRSALVDRLNRLGMARRQGIVEAALSIKELLLKLSTSVTGKVQQQLNVGGAISIEGGEW